jgi:hypothetical protein
LDYNIFYEKCKDHNIFITKYCPSCDLKICEMCFLKNHINHPIITLNELFLKNEIGIINLKSSLNDKIKTLEIENKDLSVRIEKNKFKINEIIKYSNGIDVLDITWFVKNNKDEKFNMKKRKIDLFDN